MKPDAEQAWSLPPCPDHLPDAARAEWQRLVAAVPAGRLTAADAGLLAAYYEAVALHTEAVCKVAEFGAVVIDAKGAPVASPWIGILDRQAGIILRAAAELGISPARQTRVKGRKPAAADAAPAGRAGGKSSEDRRPAFLRQVK